MRTKFYLHPKRHTLNMCTYKSHPRGWHYVPGSIPGPCDWQPVPHQLQDVLPVCCHWGATWQSIHPQYSSGYDQSHGEETAVMVLTMLGREYILSGIVLQGKSIERIIFFLQDHRWRLLPPTLIAIEEQCVHQIWTVPTSDMYINLQQVDHRLHSLCSYNLNCYRWNSTMDLGLSQ